MKAKSALLLVVGLLVVPTWSLANVPDPASEQTVGATLDFVVDGQTVAESPVIAVQDVGETMANVIHVPGDYATIQAGLDAAIAGDTVLVARGTYTGFGNKNLQFHGRAIELRCEEAGECIIDCEQSGRGFYFHYGEANASIVDGFKITEGRNPGGAGGGGIFCDNNSNPTINRCTITQCATSNAEGGGIYCESSSPVITHCIISQNSANSGGNGGGIFCFDSSPTISQCVISGNSSSNDGGGIYCHTYSNPVISRCTISGNTASGSYGDGFGGGVFCYFDSNPAISRCTISGNFATYGGGISCYDNSNPAISQCSIAENSTTNQGGGVYCEFNSYPTITLCTIMENSTVYGGGGFYCRSGGSYIHSCIFWNNQSLNFPNYAQIGPGGSSSYVTVLYCDVQGGWSYGYGIIDADPLFVDASNHDYHLTSGSPCRDAGDPYYLPAPGETDIDGQPRIMNGRVDMGLDEYPYEDCNHNGISDHQDILDGTSLDCNGNDTPDECELDCNENDIADSCDIAAGTSQDSDQNGIPDECNHEIRVPADYSTIQAALDASSEDGFTTIRVAPGTYTGAGNKNLDFRGKTIALQCEGTGTCIIDCLYSGRGFDFHTRETRYCVVDGFTIKKGQNDFGSIFCRNYSSPTITRCTISGNNDGGIHCMEYSSPMIVQCTISENWSFSGGGGIYCELGSSPTITQCTISGNSSSTGGGGIVCDNSSPTITRCKISGNFATRFGGGLDCYDSSPTITQCMITGNTVADSWNSGIGGGIHCDNSNLTISQSTISGNIAQDSQGGGIYSDNNSSTFLKGCIIWGNIASYNPQLEQGVSSIVTISYSDVQGGIPTWSVGGIDGGGNINADPLFVNFSGGDFHLLRGSPCIDAGDPYYLPSPGETDIDGDPRAIDGNGDGVARVDMGADEFVVVPPACIGDMNCDGRITLADIDLFVAALGGQTAWEQNHPNCPWLNADTNSDGNVTFADIDPFVARIGTQCP